MRWKLIPTLSSDWRRSVNRFSNPDFHYLRLGLISIAVIVAAIVAAFFSAPHRPQKAEKPEQPVAAAVTPPPPAPGFNTLSSNDSPEKRTLFDPNPSATLRRAAPDAIPVPETSDPAAQIDVRRVLKLMNAGVIKYASDQDEANKVKGAKLIQIAALLGYQTARNLIVVNYPQAASVRIAVPAPDVILYAADLLTRRDDADPQFVALANYFTKRGESVAFGKIMVDVVRDNARLRESEHLEVLFNTLRRVPGACSTIKRVVLGDPAIDENDCSDTLRQAILIYAKAKGPAGLESDAQDRGLELMQKADAAQRLGATGVK